MKYYIIIGSTRWGCARRRYCYRPPLAASMGPPTLIVQELCESRGGRPGLSVLTSLIVSVDVKLY